MAGALGGSGVQHPRRPRVTEQLETPARLRTPRWGFGDVVVTLLGALVIGNVLALLLLPPTTPDHPVTGHAWQTLLVLVGPWVALAGWPLFATRTRGNGPVRDLGSAHDLAVGGHRCPVRRGGTGHRSRRAVDPAVADARATQRPRSGRGAHLRVDEPGGPRAVRAGDRVRRAGGRGAGVPRADVRRVRQARRGAGVVGAGHHGAVRAVPLRAAAAARARRARRRGSARSAPSPAAPRRAWSRTWRSTCRARSGSCWRTSRRYARGAEPCGVGTGRRGLRPPAAR